MIWNLSDGLSDYECKNMNFNLNIATNILRNKASAAIR